MKTMLLACVGQFLKEAYCLGGSINDLRMSAMLHSQIRNGPETPLFCILVESLLSMTKWLIVSSNYTQG